MWSSIKTFIEKIWDAIQQILGHKPSIPKIGKEDIEKFSPPPPQPKTAEKELALPIVDKYAGIDWKNDPPQYRKRKGVLTFQERQFHRMLVRLVGRNHQILSMVRMADVIYLSNETKDRKFFNNNIQCKHFDFVICGKQKFDPLLIVELDDPKHDYVHRKRNDDFKDKACQEAGIPVLRIKVQSTYDEAEIKQMIDQKINTLISQPNDER